MIFSFAKIIFVMKLFVFDVDGTLVYNGGEISKKNKAAIQKALDDGNAIAIASGRPFIGINQYLSQFKGKNRFAIGSNGATVQDSNGKTLNISGLHFKDLLELRKKYSFIEENGGAIYAYDKNGEVIAFNESYWTFDEKKYNGIETRVINENSFSLDETILKVMVAADPSALSKLVLLDEDKIRYNAVLSDPKYLEFMSKQTDKAYGVSFLKDLLKLDIMDVYTFGDQQNDLLMIKGYNGIAMGNAIDICKENAKFITKNVEEDGIAFAFENYVK